jgi:cysteine synthase A
MATFEDNSLSIGKTPLVKLNRIVNGKETKVYGKIEGRNPPTRLSAASAPR